MKSSKKVGAKHSLAAITKIAGIIAFVAIIGFSFTACDDSNGDDNGGNGGNGGSNSKLTVNNLPSATGFSIAVCNHANVPTTKTQYSNMAGIDGGGSGTSSPFALTKQPPDLNNPNYNGTGNRLVLVSTTGLPFVYKFTVATFNNGSATVDWNTMTDRSSLPD